MKAKINPASNANGGEAQGDKEKSTPTMKSKRLRM
jgi:hypothetical protein